MTEPRVIAVSTHGRYLVRPPLQPGPAMLVVGFHGYAEGAEVQLDRIAAIPGADGWLLVSIQGLHRFYRGRTQDVVASWMTRQDREFSLADNVAYVAAVIDEVNREFGVEGAAVFAGFSQGVAMAFRAACRSSQRRVFVLANGGDVPPELTPGALSELTGVLLARGKEDQWYSPQLWAKDQERLRGAGVEVEAVALEGGHEWAASFSAAAGEYLSARATPAPPRRS